MNILSSFTHMTFFHGTQKKKFCAGGLLNVNASVSIAWKRAEKQVSTFLLLCSIKTKESLECLEWPEMTFSLNGNHTLLSIIPQLSPWRDVGGSGWASGWRRWQQCCLLCPELEGWALSLILSLSAGDWAQRSLPGLLPSSYYLRSNHNTNLKTGQNFDLILKIVLHHLRQSFVVGLAFIFCLASPLLNLPLSDTQ